MAMLCPPCTAVFQSPKFSPDLTADALKRGSAEKHFHHHHQSYGSFEEALNAPCGLCWRLVRMLTHPPSTTTGAAASNKRSQIFSADGGICRDVDVGSFSTKYLLAWETGKKDVVSFSAIFRARKGEEWRNEACTEYLFLAPEQRPLSNVLIPSPDTGPDSTAMDVLATWIEDCRTNHPACRRQQQQQGRPGAGVRHPFARIIDVGKDMDQPIVAIRTSTHVLDGSEYMTLSHSWGGSNISCLTSDNCDAFSQQVALNSLPMTFQDAIRVTRRFGVRYLWIDALCIIQDSAEDWMSHVAVMGEIYQRSFLNIAATHAKDPYGGLFVIRDPVLVTPLRVAVGQPRHSGSNGNAMDRQPGDYSTPRFYDVGTDHYKMWNSFVTGSPLCKRGWVVQERLLAPRVVHFSEEQLFWECVSSRTYEEQAGYQIRLGNSAASKTMADFKSNDPFTADLSTNMTKEIQLRPSYLLCAMRALYGHASPDLANSQFLGNAESVRRARFLCFADEPFAPTHPLLKFWAGIMRTYSSTRLTRVDDRLVAIDGLAKLLAARTGIKYVAGHWMHQLPRQLLWSFFDMRSGAAGEDHANSAINGVSSGVWDSDTHIAPSWSWASVSGGIAIRNETLDPLLEKQGAMDLIQVIGITHKRSDAFLPSNRQRLRIRGRLLPVSLDLSAWPTGPARPDSIVSFWQGTTRHPPTGETFLVPVLYLRPDRRLPEATPNALIVEGTQTKGQFRRVGTARLNSLCYLREVIPQLYNAKAAVFESPEDQVALAREAEAEEAEDAGGHSGMNGTHDYGESPQQAMEGIRLRQLFDTTKLVEQQLSRLSASSVTTGLRNSDAKMVPIQKFLERIDRMRNHMANPNAGPVPATTEAMAATGATGTATGATGMTDEAESPGVPAIPPTAAISTANVAKEKRQQLQDGGDPAALTVKLTPATPATESVVRDGDGSQLAEQYQQLVGLDVGNGAHAGAHAGANGVAHAGGGGGGAAMERRRSRPPGLRTLPPRDAVAPHYYIKYLDNDEESLRFGHFVFEIV